MRRRRATGARWYLFQRLRGRLLRLSTHCCQDDGGRISRDRTALAHASWGQTGLEQGTGRRCQASPVLFFQEWNDEVYGVVARVCACRYSVAVEIVASLWVGLKFFARSRVFFLLFFCLPHCLNVWQKQAFPPTKGFAYAKSMNKQQRVMLLGLVSHKPSLG